MAPHGDIFLYTWQEITINYQPGVIHRPDLSLYIYGALRCWLEAGASAVLLLLPRLRMAGTKAVLARLACLRWTPPFNGPLGSHYRALTACTGFVIPRDRPLLAAVDLPGFNPWDAFKPTPLDDSAYDGEGWNTRLCRWGLTTRCCCCIIAACWLARRAAGWSRLICSSQSLPRPCHSAHGQP